jgi:hypothetical protein
MHRRPIKPWLRHSAHARLSNLHGSHVLLRAQHLPHIPDVMADKDGSNSDSGKKAPAKRANDGPLTDAGSRTKAALKEFQFTDREAVKNMPRIPKKPSATASSDTGEPAPGPLFLGDNPHHSLPLEVDNSLDDGYVGSNYFGQDQDSRGRPADRGRGRRRPWPRGDASYAPSYMPSWRAGYQGGWGPEYEDPYGYDYAYDDGYYDHYEEEQVAGDNPVDDTPADDADDDLHIPQADGPRPEDHVLEETGQEIDLLAIYAGDFVSETGPPLNERVNAHVNKVWHRGRDPVKIKEQFAKHERPEGTSLYRVQLNDEIAIPLQKSHKFVITRDQRLKAIQGLIARAAVPVAKACDLLMKPDAVDKQVHMGLGLDTLTILANANNQTNQLRRDNLRPYLNERISTVVCKLRKENDPSDELFPEIQESAKQAKQGIDLINTRGRGRGRYTQYPRRGGYPGQRYGRYPRPYGGEFDTFLPFLDPISEIENDRPVYALHDFENFDSVSEIPNLMHSTGTNANVDVPVVGCRSEAAIQRGLSASRSGRQWQLRPELRRPKPTGQQQQQQQGAWQARTIDAPSRVGTCRAMITPIWDTFKANRAKTCIANWRKLSSDPWLITNLHGYKLELLETPQQARPIPEIRFNATEKAVMLNEIDTLLAKQVIVPCDTEEDEFVSNIFLRPKKESDKFRMIFNLTQLNTFVEYHHFKMETLETALKLVTPDAVMGSLDFTDAYYTLPMYHDHQKFLKFTFDGTKYKFLSVPMGLSSACRYFTKIMKIPLSALRQNHGISITGYIDDTFLIENTASQCKKALELAGDLFQKLGFMINMRKSVLTPTTRLEYLGFIIDSHDMSVVPTREKIGKLKKAARKLLSKDATTIRHMAQVEGGLLATYPGNPLAPLYTKQMEIDKLEALNAHAFDFDAFMSISDTVKLDLQWWLDNLDSVVAPILEPYPDLVIHTDASLQGHGFFVPESKLKAGYRWQPNEAHLHINVLELLAIEYALLAVCSDFSDKHIRIMCDNTTAIAAIRKQGSTRTPIMNKIARRIWLWATDKNIWLSAAHIPGVKNVEADEASRVFKDELEWTLNDDHFRAICKSFGTPNMDLFASHLNFKVMPFCSFKPDPFAAVIDAFTFKWDMPLGYAFPPFCLIGRILQKVTRDKATLILIVPDWSTKAWYPQFRNLLIAEPLSFEVHECTLYLPHRLQEPDSHKRRKTHIQERHPMAGRLTLLAGMISGSHCS